MSRPLAVAWSPPVVIVVLGAALRVWQFAADRSLWHDEAMLALNIVGRSFAELTRPLDYHQAAPLGFLFVEKLAVQLLGPGEHALRLLPLVAGLVALLLMHRITTVYLERMGLLALALFAFSERLVYYASEAKQYSSDVMWSLLLLLLAHRCLAATARPGAFVALGGAGVVALGMSHPTPFVMVGIVAALAWDAAARRAWRTLGGVGAVGVVWGLAFAGLYVVFLRPAAADPALIDVWRGGFMPAPPARALAWIGGVVTGMLAEALGRPLLVVGVPLLVAGTASLLARRRPLAVLLIAPFVAVLVAARLERYPAGGRLLLFLVPALYLLIAEGTAWLRRALSRTGARWSAAAVALVVVALLALPAAYAARRVIRPDRGEHIKPVLEYMSRRRSADEPIYLYYAAVPAFRFYAGRYGMADGVVEGRQSRWDPERYRADIDGLRAGRRAWLVFSHTCDWCPVDEERYFLRYLDEVGRRRDQVVAPGASAYLYAF